LVPGVNGENTYHYIQYNGKIREDELTTIPSGPTEAELDDEQQMGEKESSMSFLECVQGQPWVNPNMMPWTHMMY
jgi:hypothetical protein